MDKSLDGDDLTPKKKDPLDALGERVPKSQRDQQRRPPTDDLDGPLDQRRRPPTDDLDGPPTTPPDLGSLKIDKRETVKRTLSTEMDRSLVMGEGCWKTANTVHRGREEAFSDSGDSLLEEDSFAGGSFAGSDYSFSESGETEKALAQFTELDDQPPCLDSSAGNSSSPSPRRITPRRSYSKQQKRMPKKSDPLSAITEDADAKEDSDADDDSF